MLETLPPNFEVCQLLFIIHVFTYVPHHLVAFVGLTERGTTAELFHIIDLVHDLSAGTYIIPDFPETLFVQGAIRILLVAPMVRANIDKAVSPYTRLDLRTETLLITSAVGCFIKN